MRRAINGIGHADTTTPAKALSVLQLLERCFSSYCSGAAGEMNRKISTLRSSLFKVETDLLVLLSGSSRVHYSKLNDRRS